MIFTKQKSKSKPNISESKYHCNLRVSFSNSAIKTLAYLWLYGGHWYNVASADNRLIGGELEQSVRIVPIHQ